MLYLYRQANLAERGFDMNKKEILEKSRKENEGHLDERELQINANASKIGMAVGGCLSVIIVIISRILDMPLLGLSAFTVYFSMYGTRHLYNFIFTKDKVELFQAIIAIVMGITCFCGMIILGIK